MQPADTLHSVIMAPRAIIQMLYKRIEHEKVKSITGKYFIQESKVRAIFTPAIVDRAVTELMCGAPERLGLAKKIKEEATIVFAILISMGKEDHIVNFRNHDYLDHRLPISETLANEIVPEFGVSFAREFQWQFLPYVFKQDMSDYHLEVCETSRIFPFIEPVEKVADGGFGEVTKLTIPTALQHFFNSEVRRFAWIFLSMTRRLLIYSLSRKKPYR